MESTSLDQLSKAIWPSFNVFLYSLSKVLNLCLLCGLLVWDKKMVHTQFNWYWHHVPTFAPYKVEAMFLPLILAHTGSSQSVKTASIVLQSLTPNAQSVFKVLAEHQLAHPDEEGEQLAPLLTTAFCNNQQQ